MRDAWPAAPRGTCRWCGMPIHGYDYWLWWLRRYHRRCWTVKHSEDARKGRRVGTTRIALESIEDEYRALDALLWDQLTDPGGGWYSVHLRVRRERYDLIVGNLCITLEAGSLGKLPNA